MCVCVCVCVRVCACVCVCVCVLFLFLFDCFFRVYQIVCIKLHCISDYIKHVLHEMILLLRYSY